MASNSTNIHVQGFTFPGEMKDYCWEFPVVSVPTKKGDKLIYTRYFVGLLNTVVDRNIVAMRMNPTKDQRPNPNFTPNFSFANFALKLNSQLLDHSPLGTKVAFYVTQIQQGDGPSLFRDITFVTKGKNLNRKNRTNVFTQALADVLSKYNAKINVADQKNQQVVTPMLAYGEGISDRELIKAEIATLVLTHVVTGLYVQPKYDGVRVMSTLNPRKFANDVSLPYETDEDVICYSRKGKRIMITDHLQYQLLDTLTDMMKQTGLTSLVLDGEFYYHGMPLQEISGYARGSHDSETGRKSMINLIIYDFCDRSNKTFADRYEVLESCKSIIAANAELSEMMELETGNVLLSETRLYHTTDEIMDYYDQAIANNYEGIMVRLPEGVYESSRSKSLIKIKPTISYEYECVGYEFGNGKDSDIPTIRCKIGEQGVANANEWWFHRTGKSSIEKRNKDHTFCAKFKGLTETEQRSLGNEFQVIEANGKTGFENHYLGRMVEIEFLNFSVDGKPEKPNCKGFAFDK
jgi:hypothetical protein